MTSIILLLIIGFLLIFAEVFFVPGTTFVGILGLLSVVVGVVLTYNYYGVVSGNLMLLATGMSMVALFYFGFRNDAWKRFSLQETIKSKVNDEDTLILEKGSTGIAVSDLRPYGTVDFEGNRVEASTLGGHIDSGTKVKIIQIQNKKIFVAPMS